ncbi:hypothetical protein H7U19_12910 [Hyunsoonleella sp. SJ7]|uniref:Uncharacterized protein n=1 Tax=Hyunsoonleella aquatilis TaxID=2762758 RepID=A0A923HDS3_9FLAO|nr:hypothetical protein [Hyunsoonleella aquatilis]MBC3759311.1 hypothetical protein [Hyunsoonleella aquatilis]
MPHFKTIQKLLTGLVVLLTLASFDGFKATLNPSHNHNVELLSYGRPQQYTKVALFQISKSVSPKVYFVFAFFDFDCLFNAQLISSNTAFCHQNNTLSDFYSQKSSLAQNLVTILYSGDFLQVSLP